MRCLFSLRQPFDKLKNRGTLMIFSFFVFALCERKNRVPSGRTTYMESTTLPPVLSLSNGRPGTLWVCHADARTTDDYNETS